MKCEQWQNQVYDIIINNILQQHLSVNSTNFKQ